jgi:hypothetical protein
MEIQPGCDDLHCGLHHPEAKIDSGGLIEVRIPARYHQMRGSTRAPAVTFFPTQQEALDLVSNNAIPTKSNAFVDGRVLCSAGAPNREKPAITPLPQDEHHAIFSLYINALLPKASGSDWWEEIRFRSVQAAWVWSFPVASVKGMSCDRCNRRASGTIPNQTAKPRYG